MNREEIVNNGCNGGCCTNFTLPFTPIEFQSCIEAIEKGEKYFINEQGEEVIIINDPEIKKIVDMIIYNGLTEIDPQIPDSTLEERYKYAKYIPDDESIIPEEKIKINNHHDYWFWKRLIDGKIYLNTYTCKHYDTVNKICTNYENRPRMCQSFGNTCSYSGCGFVEKLKCEVSKDCIKAIEILEKIPESLQVKKN